MKMKLILTGLVILVATVAVGFIPMSEATYMQWRLVMAVGAGLSLGCGVALLAYGLATR